MFSKNKDYQNYEIDIKHNFWRIKNDLSWIVESKEDNSNKNELICLYWLDINLKNTLFPWVLKLEREIKSCFVFYYKQKFVSESSLFLKDFKNYLYTDKTKTKIESFIKRINDIDAQRNLSIDGIVFDLTFGEFINIFTYFDNDVKLAVAKYFGLNPSIFFNVLKFVSILRNAIAHNKTIIKIKDEKNNKKFSLKSGFFDFEISKKEIDIISINFSGCVYVIKKMLLLFDNRQKAKKMIKAIKVNLKDYKKHLKNKEIYEKTIQKIFLNYFKEIMKI